MKRLRSIYELAFYPEHTASKASLLWLENESKKRGVHIHHAMCGHGGECWINEAPVDGYEPTTRTVFEYHGCIWHGCRVCYPENRDQYPEGRDSGKTLEQSYTSTVQKVAELQKAGYNVVELWGCEAEQFENPQHPQVETKSYPHFIFFDFEAYVDGTKKTNLTPMLKIENEHVPISVSLGDTLNREPTHICERDPEVLVRRFVEELERRAEEIRDKVFEEFMPQDAEMLPKKVQDLIDKWCRQVPVLGFNSGKYDINLIKKYFVNEIAETTSTSRRRGTRQCFSTPQTFASWTSSTTLDLGLAMKSGSRLTGAVVKERLGSLTSGLTVPRSWTTRGYPPMRSGTQS